MSRDIVNRICAGFPGAECSAPFGPGHDVWKVGGKIFAAVGAKGEGVSLKCPDVETAQMLIEAGVGVKAPYFHRSWVNLPFESFDEAEARHRLGVAYDTIRAGLPQKAQAALPARPD
ncbi:MmcQ/YjbR family DNA-binding protein [Marimonas lutisalis]|uniref:MmcQ/YjbR family DNA-binding protein n=1 Tax=Marimonas lutisalis TaxID=2545756 RepID=UPI0010F5035D|nr:MmcQ/YjbR family DNA-binding protein [Marimonas lutisalis]